MQTEEMFDIKIIKLNDFRRWIHLITRKYIISLRLLLDGWTPKPEDVRIEIISFILWHKASFLRMVKKIDRVNFHKYLIDEDLLWLPMLELIYWCIDELMNWCSIFGPLSISSTLSSYNQFFLFMKSPWTVWTWDVGKCYTLTVIFTTNELYQSCCCWKRGLLA